jgi:cytochrome P450
MGMTAEHTGVIDVTGYADANEAWRCPHLTTRTAGPGDEEVRAGTVVRLDGEAHRMRRRAMSQLLSRGGHKYFRDHHLFPTADTALAEALKHPNADGLVRLDVRTWARRVNQQLAAALVGFDEAVTPDGADELFGLVETFILGYQGVLANALELYVVDGAAQRASREARDEMVRRFYEPALARRRGLLAKVASGELSESDLPQDLLTLIALERDPAWADDALAKREAVFLLGAGVHTTSNSLVWTLRELFAHFAEHPEDEQFRTDEQFLLGAAREALRLHPVTPGFVRRVEQDVELPSGMRLSQGALAVIRNGPASADADYFEVGPTNFDPRRTVERAIPPHGLAFGAGPHMCFGMPIVMGAEGLDGSLMYLLKLLMVAGVQPDPQSPAVDVVSARARYDNANKTVPLHVLLPVQA